MDQFDQLLEIRLDDGRAIVARPRPEDQDLLRQAGREVTLELGSSDFDTSAHGLTSDLTIDVEGHAMTLRLPTPADAEALRRMLMVGAISATIVAAGAIAALQGNAPTAGSQGIVAPPPPAGATRLDFQERREQAIDQMLAAPAAVSGQPSDIEFERINRISAPAQVAPQADFQTRKEQAADKLLEAPAGEAPASADDQGGSHRVGGPQD
jgi:hypothetical protein